MKRVFSCVVILSLCCCLVFSAALAESFDPSRYSYDELVIIRDQADAAIKEMDRQYAIEHGDRTIKFEEESYLVYLKTTLKLAPAVEKVLETAPDKTTLTWESSDDTVAKVANGTVTPVAVGTATITAKAADNDLIFGSCEVRVISSVAKVTAAETDFTLQLNVPEKSRKDLTVEITPEDAYCKDVIWSSSDENIVTVDDNGQVTAVGVGKAKVIAKTADEFKYQTAIPQAAFNITVVNAVTGINLVSDSMLIGKGATQAIEYAIVPEDATNQKLEIVSSDPNIASVGQGGKLVGKSGGECDITMKTTDGSEITATFHVKVEQLVKGIKINPYKLSIRVGNTEKLECTVAPADANNKEVRWTSSNTKVAQVSSTGIVTPVGGGDCEIICEAKDGSGISAKISVHVPSLHTDKTEYTVTSKNGLDIPVYWDKHGFAYCYTASGCFNCDWVDHKVHIDPIKAGSGTLIVYLENEKQEALNIKVTIESSAVYDQKSYPLARYEDVLRYPGSYKNTNISIKGRIVQVVNSGNSVVLRVGTGGYGLYDKVFWVEYDKRNVTTPVIEDDRVIIYGKCTGTETYTSTFGQSITIPSLEAEKIVLGK